jgi:hypothetical protein
MVQARDPADAIGDVVEDGGIELIDFIGRRNSLVRPRSHIVSLSAFDGDLYRLDCRKESDDLTDRYELASNEA